MITDVIRTRETIVLDDAAKVRRTKDGYLVAEPRVARTGIQVYAGTELGKADMARVRVWRPEAEVFHKDAMGSVAHRPITNSHPKEQVNAKNWRKYSVGSTGGDVARDGEFIRVPMTVMDADTIADIDGGKKELSLGYTSDLEWRSGKTDDGEEYDAVQTHIRINHLAVVDAARGGPKLVLGDEDGESNRKMADQGKTLINAKAYTVTDSIAGAADNKSTLWFKSSTPGLLHAFAKDGKVYRGALVSIKAQAEQSSDGPLTGLVDELLTLIDTKQKERRPMNDVTNRTINVDGVSVEMSDTAAQIVNRAIKVLTDNLAKAIADKTGIEQKLATDTTALNTKIAELTTAVSTKDAELVTVKKQLEDSKLTPAKLDELVKDRSEVVGRARALLGDKLVVDGKTEAEIRRQVVDAQLGDAAKGWDDVMVKASFMTLTKDVKAEQIQAADQMARTFQGQPNTANDREAPYNKYDANIQDAWKNPNGAPAARTN